MDTTPGFEAPAPDPAADSRSDARLAESYLSNGKRALSQKEAAAARKLDPKNARLAKLPR